VDIAREFATAGLAALLRADSNIVKRCN